MIGKIIRFAVSFVLVGGLLFLVLFLTQNIYKVSSLPEKRQGENEIGYLYLVKVKATGEQYYVVADTKLEPAEWNEYFTADYIDTSYLWNPKTCAKMPTVVSKEGDIYMLETSFENNKFVKQLIKFEASENIKKYINISALDVLSGLYQDNKEIFFMYRDSSSVKKVSLNKKSFGGRWLWTHTTSLKDVAKMSLVSMRENQEGDLLLLLSKDLVTKDYFKYDRISNSFESTVDTSVSVDLRKTNFLKNGQEIYRDSENELVSGLVLEGVKVPYLKVPGAYLYTIGSI